MRKLLIDGNHLCGRNWATLRDAMTTDGRHSGVVFGFIKSMLYVHKELSIDFPEMVVFWDGGRSEFRKKLWPGYKSGRYSADPTPEEKELRNAYIHQLNELRQLVDHWGCKQAWASGVEADDLIGVYARFYVTQGYQSIIFSGDHDMHQLAEPCVSIFDPKLKLLNVGEICAKWGYTDVKEIPYFKAICGDSSDAIPGIKGMGPVRARQVLKYFDNGTFNFDLVDKKDEKYVKEFIRNLELVDRNLKLMQLPRSWKEGVERGIFTVEQCEEASGRLANSGKSADDVKFNSFLTHWELNSLLGKVGVW